MKYRTQCRSVLAWPLLALACFAVAATPAWALPALYVISLAQPPTERIWELDPLTYAVRRPVFEEAPYPLAMASGADGELYVMNELIVENPGDPPQFLGYELHRYDGATTAHEGVVFTANSTDPMFGRQMLIGENGDLYVSGRSGNAFSLYRYDLDTGALVDTLPDVGEAFTFGSDGLLYAALGSSTQIDRYDPETFQNLGMFWAGSGGDAVTRRLTFDSAGNLYAVEGYPPSPDFDQIEAVRVDPNGTQTGASGRVDEFFGGPYDLEFNPFTGHLLSSTDAPYLIEWDLEGGGSAPASAPIFPGGGSYFGDFLFVPEPAGTWLLLAGLVGLLGGRRRFAQRPTRRARNGRRPASLTGMPCGRS